MRLWVSTSASLAILDCCAASATAPGKLALVPGLFAFFEFYAGGFASNYLFACATFAACILMPCRTQGHPLSQACLASWCQTALDFRNISCHSFVFSFFCGVT